MSEPLTAPGRLLALIPARGGSKRLPRKNLLPLAGTPLIAWTIRAARESGLFDRILVSTEDEEIARRAREAGAETPFLRPPELAGDHAPTLGAILHALETLAGQGEHFDYVAVLQPTSPLRNADDIRGAVALLRRKQADAVISVCRTDHPPEWCNTLPPDGSMRDFFRPGVRETRSQDLPPSYRLNGAIYLYACGRLLESRSLEMDDCCYAYVMPRERSIDIDTELDLKIAEILLRKEDGRP
ncbi:MAG: acylneuraminate cytidylyltransferase family protein [Gammaproteobacteria bacterium]|nr:MAG: acylneuraminate cytidylyltransferase family protein [Gammaproteobacteria bacterium]